MKLTLYRAGKLALFLAVNEAGSETGRAGSTWPKNT